MLMAVETNSRLSVIPLTVTLFLSAFSRLTARGLSRHRAIGDVRLPRDERKDGGGLALVGKGEIDRRVRKLAARHLKDMLLQRIVVGIRIIDAALFGAGQTFGVVVRQNGHRAVIDEDLAETFP